MIGIIIAAGMGTRLKSVTEQTPKCLLPMSKSGQTMLNQTIRNMKKAGCRKHIVITGHANTAFEKVLVPQSVEILYNKDYKTNNILHSLMTAIDFFEDDLIISYSDIWVELCVYEKLMSANGSAALAVDYNWKEYYQDRDDHPLEQAEKVIYQERDGINKVLGIGKVLPQKNTAGRLGEFLGLMKLEQDAAKKFRGDFTELNRTLDKSTPFQQAPSWEKAYITDFVQHQIDKGVKYVASTINKGWAEFDTVQDYERLPQIAVTQNLVSLKDPQPLALMNQDK